MSHVDANLPKVDVNVAVPPWSKSPTEADELLILGDPFIPQILQLSQQVFPGPVTYEVLFDPSEPEDKWLTFNVNAAANYTVLSGDENHWHELIENLTNDRSGRYRLSVYPIADLTL